MGSLGRAARARRRRVPRPAGAEGSHQPLERSTFSAVSVICTSPQAQAPAESQSTAVRSVHNGLNRPGLACRTAEESEPLRPQRTLSGGSRASSGHITSAASRARGSTGVRVRAPPPRHHRPARTGRGGSRGTPPRSRGSTAPASPVEPASGPPLPGLARPRTAPRTPSVFPARGALSMPCSAEHGQRNRPGRTLATREPRRAVAAEVPELAMRRRHGESVPRAEARRPGESHGARPSTAAEDVPVERTRPPKPRARIPADHDR